MYGERGPRERWGGGQGTVQVVVPMSFCCAVNKAKVKHGCMECGIVQMILCICGLMSGREECLLCGKSKEHKGIKLMHGAPE